MLSMDRLGEYHGSDDHVAVGDITGAFNDGYTVGELPRDQIDDGVWNIALSSYRDDHGSLPRAESSDSETSPSETGSDSGEDSNQEPAPGNRAGTRSVEEVAAIIKDTSRSLPGDVSPTTVNEAKALLREQYGSVQAARIPALRDSTNGRAESAGGGESVDGWLLVAVAVAIGAAVYVGVGR